MKWIVGIIYGIFIFNPCAGQSGGEPSALELELKLSDGSVSKISWMTENLRSELASKICYDYDDKNCEHYGSLYTYEEAMKACPAGWRLPTTQDLENLVDHFGGGNTAEMNLKSNTNWDDNKDGTNHSKLNFLPAGSGRGARFSGMGYLTYVWTSDIDNMSRATVLRLDDMEDNDLIFSIMAANRASVRCVKTE